MCCFLTVSWVCTDTLSPTLPSPAQTTPSFTGCFKSLYWICYNIASVLHFEFLAERYVGILAPRPLHLHPPHWKAKSELSDPQGSPHFIFRITFCWSSQNSQGLCALLRGPVDLSRHNDPPRPGGFPGILAPSPHPLSASHTSLPALGPQRVDTPSPRPGGPRWPSVSPPSRDLATREVVAKLATLC